MAMSYNGEQHRPQQRQHKAYSDGSSTDSTAAETRGAFSDAFSRNVSGSSGSAPDTEVEGSPVPARVAGESPWGGAWPYSYPEGRLSTGGPPIPNLTPDCLSTSGAIAPPPGLGPDTGGQDPRDGALRNLQDQVGHLQRELETLMAHMEQQSDQPITSKQWHNVVTVMMRNLPNKYTQRMLKAEIDAAGFDGLYDFLYLPIDRLYGANKGYAFINFVGHEHVAAFRSCFDSRPMRCFKSHKVVSVVPASWQGYAANYKHFYNASVNHGDPDARPLFLQDQQQLAKKQQRPSGGQQGLPPRPTAAGYRDKNVPPQLDHESSSTGAPLYYPPMSMTAPAQAAAVAMQAMHVPLPSGTSAPFGGEGWGVSQQQPVSQPPSRERKFCTACGARVPPTASFCTDCGHRLPVIP